MISLFQSSVNPEKLSLTIKGLIPLILVLIGVFGFNITELQINELVNSFINVVVAITGVLSAIATFYGLVRKLKNIRK